MKIIDWIRAEKDPEGKQKIQNQALLDIRDNIEEIKNHIAENKKELDKINIKILGTEKSLEWLTERINIVENNTDKVLADIKNKTAKKELEINESLNKILNDVQSMTDRKDNIEEIKKSIDETNKIIEVLNESLEDPFSARNNGIEEVKKKFEETREEINEMRGSMGSMNRKIESFKSEFVEKEKEVSSLKTDLERTDKQIKIDKNGLDYAISNKDAMIKKLENDLESKIGEVNELNLKLSDLSDTFTFSNEESQADIVSRIKDIMEFKGYLSDAEFSLILSKVNKEDIELDF